MAVLYARKNCSNIDSFYPMSHRSLLYEGIVCSSLRRWLILPVL